MLLSMGLQLPDRVAALLLHCWRCAVTSEKPVPIVAEEWNQAGNAPGKVTVPPDRGMFRS